jgi:hypothetical protein
MTMSARRCRRCVALLSLPLLAAAACLSSAPPAPPVRHFDPLRIVAAATPVAATAATPATATGPRLRVVAAAHLGQDFVVRVAPRELTFDTTHRWIQRPDQLVAAAVGPPPPLLAAADGATAVATAAGGELVLELVAFELDVVAAPLARIRVVVPSGGAWAAGAHTVEVPAADTSPPAFAEAMAKALLELAARVHGR